MDRNLVYHALRKLELMRRMSTTFRKPSSALLAGEDYQLRRQEANRIWSSYETLDDELHAYLAAYSKPECMALCITFQRKLPRELRDMVYTYLLPRQTHTIQHHDEDRYGPENWPPYSWIASLFRPNCDHLFNQGYVPLTTMKEIGEMWYKVTTFYFNNVQDIEYRSQYYKSITLDLLGRDRWNLGIDVAQHVMNMQVSFDFVFPSDQNLTRLLTDLQELIPLKPKARVTVRLESNMYSFDRACAYGLEEFVEKFSVVFPVLESLVRGGKIVVISVHGHDIFEVKAEELKIGFWVEVLMEVIMALKRIRR